MNLSDENLTTVFRPTDRTANVLYPSQLVPFESPRKLSILNLLKSM